jgi:type IV pilus assembly protein PilB
MEETMTMRIGELCVNVGLITEKQVKEALEKQKKSKKKIGEILVELGYIRSQELNLMLSVQSAKT